MTNISYWGMQTQKMDLIQSPLTTVMEIAVIIASITLVIWLIRHWN